MLRSRLLEEDDIFFVLREGFLQNRSGANPVAE